MSYFGVATTKLLTQIKKSSGAVRKDLWEKLYALTANHLKVVAGRYLIDRSLIEDATSEAYARAMVYIDKCNTDLDGYNWLCKIVENAAKDMNKKNGREIVGLPDNYAGREGDFSVQAYIEEAEERNAVMEAVNKMPPDLQELYYLECIEGKSRKEIADMKKVAKSTITKRCNKIVAFIRKELEKSDF